MLFVLWLFAVWPPPVWWRDHEPRCTAMMRLRADVQTCQRVARKLHDGTTARLHEDTHLLQRMVIIAEDSRFKTHHGIDFIELRDAWAAGGHRGASTITQQLAKNLYLSPSRSMFRKLKEAVTAVRLELALSKDRIMQLYLNTAEWGPGVWGASAASDAYCKTPVPPALEDSIPEIPPIEPPVLPVIPDSIAIPDTLSVPDTTKDHPDSGGPVDTVRRLVYKP